MEKIPKLSIASIVSGRLQKYEHKKRPRSEDVTLGTGQIAYERTRLVLRRQGVLLRIFAAKASIFQNAGTKGCQRMNEQLEILRPFVTEAITKLVEDRLFHGLKFFVHGRLPHGRAQSKLALLLVKIANPEELLTKEEAALLNGSQRKTSSRSGETGSRKTGLKSPVKKRLKPR